MKEILQSAKDFKIIPDNFQSSTTFELINVDDKNIKIKLVLTNENELKDYEIGSNVEVFGVNNVGLVYFETKILEKDGANLTLALNQDFSIIQRREYSRVNLAKGNIVFKDLADDFVQKVEDISAGGVRFVTKTPLEADKHYDVEILLSNNMRIECALQPVRITQEDDYYLISGKFINLENADRIVLVQYAFKIKMEEQNKEND